MDNRTDQIREGAGLDESRINQDFIDMLQKWSTPALFVIAAIVLAYAGWGFLKDRANAKVNEAFEEVAGSVDYTVNNPSPTTLSAIRAQHGDIEGITPMTSLREADVYLEAAIKGVAPGSELALDENNQPTGEYAEEDLLSADEIAGMLTKAEGLYRAVAESDQGGDGWAIHRLGAQFGLAAVAESKGDSAGAKSAYEAAKSIADSAGFSLWSQIAAERLETVDQMSQSITLVSSASLPKEPEPESEVVDPAIEGPAVDAGADTGDEAGDGSAVDDDTEAPAEEEPAGEGEETGEDDG
ncbi:MAG: hypothetical protein Phyf2KO_13780 [Phycisphaerales bacterium]